MYLIFGLGNPGAQYAGTRHNAGFDLLDVLADEADIDINKNKFKSMVGEGFIAGEKVVLIKPMTFMNLSGEAVVQALNFYKPQDDEFIIIYDDVDLKPGAVRVREKGSAGGHNGMKSIIGLTGSSDFIRVRIGVGGPRGNMITHVLGKFSGEEEKDYEKGLLLAKDAVKTIIKEGVKEAMNRFNASGKAPKKKMKKTDLGREGAREARARLSTGDRDPSAEGNSAEREKPGEPGGEREAGAGSDSRGFDEKDGY